MSKKLLIIGLLLIGSAMYGQHSVESPYSFYGLGKLRYSSVQEDQLMGGVSVYADSTRLNLNNPASYGSLKYTTFALGGNLSRSRFASQEKSVLSRSTSFDYLALGFSVLPKWSVGLGVNPYSSRGYKVYLRREEQGVETTYQYEGEGGVNQIFASTGYELFKGFNVGATVYFNFGSSQTMHLRSSAQEQLSTQEVTQSYMKGVSYRLGAIYKRPVFKKWIWTTAVSFTPESQLQSDNTQSISTLEFSPSTGGILVRNTYTVDLSSMGLERTILLQPWQWSAGIGIGEDKKWGVALDYMNIGLSDFGNELVATSEVTYQNVHRWALGGFYLPKYNSFTNYFKRIVYRFGIRYERGGIRLKNQSIDDFGISFGTSLPLVGLSDFTIGVEYGQRGTLQSQLLRENYWNLKIGFSLSDKWFQRSKIK